MKFRIKYTIFFLFFAVFIFFYLSVLLFIPKQLNIIVDNEHTFNIDFPVSAKIINTDDDTVLSIDNDINLINSNISITSTEQGQYDLKMSFLGIPIANTKLNVLPNIELIPLGNTVEIGFGTDVVKVARVHAVFGKDGKPYAPSRDILEQGDTILKANSKEIKSVEDLTNIIQENKDNDLVLEIERDGKTLEVTVTPVQAFNLSNEYKYSIGISVTDMSGFVGTLTYYNPSNDNFGSIAHEILNDRSAETTYIEDGELSLVGVLDVEKSKRNKVNQYSEFVRFNNLIGNVLTFTDFGAYGQLTDITFINQNPLPIALKDEVEVGSAKILCTISSTEVKEYDIEITSINKYNTETKRSFDFKLTDEELLNATGGFVQGMSGSPIIQNGKIIGALSTIYESNTSTATGTFIENMLKQELNLNN